MAFVTHRQKLTAAQKQGKTIREGKVVPVGSSSTPSKPSGTASAEQKLRQRLQGKGQAMPPSQTNKSNSPRFPIQARTGKNSLASAIRSVGRAKPNTPAEHAKVRAYIKRVAKKKGWHNDIPDSWNKSKAGAK